MGGACSLPGEGGRGSGRSGSLRSEQGAGRGAPGAVDAEARAAEVSGHTKVVPALSHEEVSKREAARKRERRIGRTIDIIWTHFDTDGNGELDPSEFAALVSETMKGGGADLHEFSEEEIEELMRMIDTDGDGSISRSEFKELVLGLTGLTEKRRDEIAMLSVVMCKAMMFVEAVVNQSTERAPDADERSHHRQQQPQQQEHQEQEEGEVQGEGKHQVKNDEYEGKVQVPKFEEREQQEKDKTSEPDGLDSDSRVGNFSWRPTREEDGLLESKASSSVAGDDNNDQEWELLPV